MGPQPPVPLIGKGTLGGTVIDAKTHEPVKKARVTVGGPVQQLTAVTDAGGTFAFHALPPGPYFVMANHEEYSNDQSNMGQNITLADEEEKRDVVVRLQPSATISGRVVDEDDTPIANCFVAAMRFSRGAGRRRMEMNMGGNTDGQGRYRIHGIPQGRYVLRAQCGDTFPAPHGFMPRNDPLIPQEGYAPLVRPDAIRAEAGAELSGIDFHLKRVSLYVVRGTISGARQDLMRSAQIMLHPSDALPGEDSFAPPRFGPATNEFTFRHVPAGSYQVVATLFDGEHSYEARQSIEAGKAPLTEVDLKLAPGPTLTGSIDIDDPNQKLEGQQLSLQPAAENYRGPFPMASINKDGTFEFKNMLPGTFRMNGVPMGYVKSLTMGGREVDPNHIEIAAEGGGTIHISVGTKMGKVMVALDSPMKANDAVTAFLVPPNGDQAQALSVSGANSEISFPYVAPGKYRVLILPGQNLYSLAGQTEVLKSLESRSVPVEVHESGDEKVTAGIAPADELQKAMDADE
jgi:hypothetical protein